MKKLLGFSLLGLVVVSGCLSAATRGDVRVLEAADSIRYVSSKMAKEYFLYLQFPRKKQLNTLLMQDMATLEANLHDIAVFTKDPKTRGVLKFFAYKKVQIKSLLEKAPSIQNGKEILDFSESFVEGSAAIARRHQYAPNAEEAMWILTRTMNQVLEEIIKYYLAAHIIKDDPELKRKMKNAAERLSQAFTRINAYASYPDDLKKMRTNANVLWKTLSMYLGKLETLPLPLIGTLMGEQMETLIDALGVYHSTNQ